MRSRAERLEKGDREQQINGVRELALVKNCIGVGQKWPLVKWNT